MINLTAVNEEKVDILAYNIVSTALFLARDDIPGALAAYDDSEVSEATGLLRQQHLISRSIQPTRKIKNIYDPLKYLNHPNVARLRTNISRTRQAKSPESGRLVELLETEYCSPSTNAELNSAT